MDLGSLRRFLPGSRSKPSSEGAPAAESGVSPSDRPAVPAWRLLPGLAPTIGPAPLVARSRGYEQELAGGRGTPLALQRLTHDRGLDAPRGLVAAATAPVSRLPAEPMPTSARRGRGRRSSGSPAVARTGSDESVAADVTVQADADPTLVPDGVDASSQSDEPHADPLLPAAVSAPSATRAVAVADAAQPVRHAASERGALPSPVSVLPAPVVARQVGTGPSLIRSAPVSSGPPGIVGERAVGMARSRAAGAGSPDTAPSSVPTGPRAFDGSGAVAQSASSRDTASPGPLTVSRAGAPTTSMSAARSPTAASPRSEQASPEPNLTVSRAVGRVRRVRFDAAIGAAIRPTDLPGAAPAVAREVDAAAPSLADPLAQSPAAPSAELTPAAGAAISAISALAATSAPSADSPAGIAAAAAAPLAVPIRPVAARAVNQGSGPLVGTLRPASDPSSPAVAVGRSLEALAEVAAPEPGSPSAALAALSRADPYGALGGEFAPGFAPTSPGWTGSGSAAGPVMQRSVPHPAGVPTASTAGRQAGVGPAGTALPDPGSAATFGPVPVVGTPGEGVGMEGFERGGMPGRVVARSRETTSRGLPSAFGGRPTVLRLAPASRAGTATVGPTVGTISPAAGSMGPGNRSVGSVRGFGSVRAVDQVGGASPRGSVLTPAFMGSVPTIQGSFAAPDGPAAGTSWSMDAGPGDAEPASGPDTLGAMVQRSLGGSAESSSADVQRAPADAAPIAAAGGAAGAGAAGAGPSARELDELAKKLYEPLRRRLHREFIVDRERDGSLLNLGR